MVSADDVAAYILERHSPISAMKLQMLVWDVRRRPLAP
jgi:hypothetical protein